MERDVEAEDAVELATRLFAEQDERRGGTVTLPADYVADHVELGWAVTGYGTQGDTVDIGIAALEPSSSRNHAYVVMTRGRHANHALLVDPTGTLDPGERLAEIITRPAATHSTLATQTRPHRTAGIEPPDPITATQNAITQRRHTGQLPALAPSHEPIACRRRMSDPAHHPIHSGFRRTPPRQRPRPRGHRQRVVRSESR